MKKYEVDICIGATKTLVVEAEDEDEAEDIAFGVCDNTVIPITPADQADIQIVNIIEVD